MEVSSCKSIDVDRLRDRPISTPFPHLVINDLNTCIPIVVSALESGNLPLVGTLNGKTKIVKRISESAYNALKLLQVTKLTWVASEADRVPINNIEDYLGVV